MRDKPVFFECFVSPPGSFPVYFSVQMLDGFVRFLSDVIMGLSACYLHQFS